jgi:hypothetical protein
MTSIARSEMEALPPKRNCTETADYKLGEDGKRTRRNSEDLMGSPNRCSPKLPKPDNDAMDEDNNPDLNLIQLEKKFGLISIGNMAGHSMKLESYSKSNKGLLSAWTTLSLLEAPQQA